MKSVLAEAAVASVVPLADVVDMAAGETHAVALTADGRLWLWGENDHKQLGTWIPQDQTVPVYLRRGKWNIETMTAGEDINLYLSDQGQVFVQGMEGVGMFGPGFTEPWDDWANPSQVYETADPYQLLSHVTAVATGPANVALKEDGTVWQWGTKRHGSELSRDLILEAVQGDMAPKQIEGLPLVQAIAASDRHFLAVGQDGRVYEWTNRLDAIRTEPSVGTHPTVPQQVDGISGIVAVAASEEASVALAADGTVWKWGEPLSVDGSVNGGGYNQTPRQVTGLANIRQVAVQGSHVYALDESGQVWEKRHERGGQPDPNAPDARPIPSLDHVVKLSANGFVMALTADGTVKSFGANDHGQLGDGTTIDRTEPVTVRKGVGTPAFDPALIDNVSLTVGAEERRYRDGENIVLLGHYVAPSLGPLIEMPLTLTLTLKGGAQVYEGQVLTGWDGKFRTEIPVGDEWPAGTYIVRVKGINNTEFAHSFQILKPFADLSGHWAAADIKVLIERGIVNGYPDGTFRPDAPVTRAEIAKIFTAAQGITAYDGAFLQSYRDAGAFQEWSRAGIAKAAEHRIMGGYPDGTFRPSQHVLRGEMAKIVTNGAPYLNHVRTDSLPYADRGRIPEWAKPAIAYNLFNNGMHGSESAGGTVFRASDRLTRAEACSLIARLLPELQRPKVYTDGRVILPKALLTKAWSGFSVERPFLAGDKVIGIDRANGTVKALEPATGRELWTRQPAPTDIVRYEGPRAASATAVALAELNPDPGIHGEMIYDGVTLLSAEDGRLLWSKQELGAPVADLYVLAGRVAVLTAERLLVYEEVSGRLLWQTALAGGTVVEANAERLLAATGTGTVRAFTWSGQPIFTAKVATGVTGIAQTQGIWAAVQGDAVTGLNPNGTKRWEHRLNRPLVGGRVAVSEDGVLYGATSDQALLALHPLTGSLLKSKTLAYQASDAPAVHEGFVYLTTEKGHLAVLDTSTFQVRGFMAHRDPADRSEYNALNWRKTPLVAEGLLIGEQWGNKTHSGGIIALKAIPSIEGEREVYLEPVKHELALAFSAADMPLSQAWSVTESPGAHVVQAGHLAVSVNGYQGVARAYDITTGQRVWYSEPAADATYTGLAAASPQYVLMTTGSAYLNSLTTLTQDGVRMISAANGETLWSRSLITAQERPQIVALAVAGDKAYIATQSTLYIYGAADGRFVSSVKIKNGTISALAADVNRVVVGTQQGSVYGYTAQGSSLYSTSLNGGAVKAVTLHPNGSSALISQSDSLTALSTQGVRLWKQSLTGLSGRRVAVEGNTVHAAHGASLTSLDARTGHKLRAAALPLAVADHPVVDHGKLYVTAQNGTLLISQSATLTAIGAVTRFYNDQEFDNPVPESLGMWKAPLVYQGHIVGRAETPNATGERLVTFY